MELRFFLGLEADDVMSILGSMQVGGYFCAVAPDMRGYGITMKPKDYAYRRTIQIASERLYDADEPYWRMKTME